MNFKNHFLLLCLLMVVGIQAQEQLITQQEVLSKVKERNHTLQMAAQDTEAARGDYQQSNALFLPSITASHTGMATTNPLMAFGSKLNQEILTQADFNPLLLNDPAQIEHFATSLQVQQPLINVDGWFQRRAAKAKLEATSLQATRTSQYLRLEVAKAYMQLQLAYKTLTVLEKAREAAMANKKLADNSFKQGYLQKADVLAVEVRVTEINNQLMYAKSNIKNASHYLSVLMNEDSSTVYKPVDELKAVVEEVSTATFSEQRADIKAMQYATKAYKEMHRSDKMSFLPKLNAFGSYELHDDEIFKADAKGYTFGAQLSWNLFEGSKRLGKAKKSKAEFKKSELAYDQYVAQSKMELSKAERMLTDSKNNLKLSALALEQSKEALRIRTNRFKQGLEKTTDLLNSETQYAQKQLAYYATVFQHNYTVAYLQFLTQ